MLGRRISHPASTNFDGDDLSPPAKRLKTRESFTDENESRNDSGDVSESAPHTPRIYTPRDEIPDSDDENDSGDENQITSRPTELESALPPVKIDKEAIKDYEAKRAGGEVPADLKSRISQREWTRGKSSIYVDAFNLALDTVLEDEGHLFDEKELEVFNQWSDLQYEAQYL